MDKTNVPAALTAGSATRQSGFPHPGAVSKSTAGFQPAPDLPLTERELEILKLIASGHSTKEIAARLGISFKTAACHRMHIMQKLGIHETASLVRWAVREKLVKA